MSFSCSNHGWSHLLNPCPWCFQHSMSGDATDISKVTFTKEQALNLAVETWKAREACWNRELEQLRSKLSAAEKEIENLKSAGIHTCHDNCQNRVCILRKENESLKAKLALAATALEELCTGLYYTSRSSCIHICERTLKAINGVREGLV